MGDIHAGGNPHYLLDPICGMQVARLICDKLSELRPNQKAYFEQRYDEFCRRTDELLVGEPLAQKYKPDDIPKLCLLFEHGKLEPYLKSQKEDSLLGGWLGMMLPYYGTKAVDDHNMWPYFARRFGLRVIAHMEPKPGIPPTTQHLSEVSQQMRAQQVRLILANPYYDPAARAVSGLQRRRQDRQRRASGRIAARHGRLPVDGRLQRPPTGGSTGGQSMKRATVPTGKSGRQRGSSSKPAACGWATAVAPCSTTWRSALRKRRVLVLDRSQRPRQDDVAAGDAGAVAACRWPPAAARRFRPARPHRLRPAAVQHQSHPADHRAGVRPAWVWSAFARPRPNGAERLSWALGAVGLDGMEARDFWSLSGGQRQRALVARALIRRPSLLVADEPTSGLDLSVETALYESLAELNRSRAADGDSGHPRPGGRRPLRHASRVGARRRASRPAPRAKSCTREDWRKPTECPSRSRPRLPARSACGSVRRETSP